MSELIRYQPDAALSAVPDTGFPQASAELLAAREAVLRDTQAFADGAFETESKQPLDAGFVDWPQQLLEDMKRNGADSLIAQIEQCAARLRGAVDSVVVLGIGGSYMGMRAMFEALFDPWHNELDRAARQDVPAIYFEGWNVDSDQQRALLRLLQSRASRYGRDTVAGRTAVIVISKSGGTLETAIAFRNFRAFIEHNFPDEVRNLIVPVTGDAGKLRNLAENAGYEDVFSIPDGIGGRFSVLTAVGLLPAAVAGINIRRLLQGAADMTEHFREADFGANAVLDYTAMGHLLEQPPFGMTTRVLSTWGSRLEAVGLWYDQLLSESLGKAEKGATPLTGVNTRDLHSRGQQHQDGRRDKLITNLLPGTPSLEPLGIPSQKDDADELNRFSGLSVPEILQAAIAGTNQAYAKDKRPTADLILPAITEHSVGQLFQLLMLATVTEGELIGINPYGQPGVEDYKNNMMSILQQQIC